MQMMDNTSNGNWTSSHSGNTHSYNDFRNKAEFKSDN